AMLEVGRRVAVVAFVEAHAPVCASGDDTPQLRVEIQSPARAVEAEVSRCARRELRIAAELEPVPLERHERLGSAVRSGHGAESLAIVREAAVQRENRSVRLNQRSAGAEAEQHSRVEVELPVFLEVQMT